MDKVLLGLISGIAFGFVIQRVGATNSDKMARAHLMIEPQIPQFMLLAVIFGAIGVFGLKLAGWDATEELISALKDGKLDLLLAQKPREMGSLCVEWGYKHFKKGAEIPKKVIPGFEFFTRDNVDDPDMQKWIYGK